MINEQIHQLMLDKINARYPGAVVAVIKDGEALHRQGYGLANVEWQITNTPETVFRLASITKQFTAVAIMMLVEQDQLSLDDPITKFFPDFSTSGHHVTVTHLLNHTSGIKSYTSLPDFMDFVRDNLTPQQMYEKFAHLPFDFAPADKWSYNNSGYILLGMIIEKISNQSYEDFIKQNIFEPLGMKTASYLHNYRIVPNRASGYNIAPDGTIVNAMFLDMSIPYAAGALGAAVDDLVKWDKALHDNTLISSETLTLMHKPTRLNTGVEYPYGFGWGVHNYHGYPAVMHSGGIFGFATQMIHLLEQRIAVIVLANNTSIDVTSLALTCVRRVLNIPDPQYTEITLSPEQLIRAEGDFEMVAELTGDVVPISFKVENGQLKSPQLPSALVPFSEHGFYLADNLEWAITFEDDFSIGAIRNVFGNSTLKRMVKPAEAGT